MTRRPLALLPILLAACASPRGLDEPSMRLSPAERATVATKVEEARSRRLFTEAWDQTVAAGADRAALEGIALDAVAAKASAGEDMLVELRRKWGGLTPEGQARSRALVAEAEARGDWKGALEVALLTADDAPAYAAAWQVYRDAPPDQGPGLLERIAEARGEDDGG